jgi:hypothetical protein
MEVDDALSTLGSNRTQTLNALIGGEPARVTLKTTVDPCPFEASVTFWSDTTAVDGTESALTGDGYGTSVFWWIAEMEVKTMREAKVQSIMLRFRPETFRLPPFYNDRKSGSPARFKRLSGKQLNLSGPDFLSTRS